MAHKKGRLRNRTGGAMIGLIISLMFVVLFLGLFAFDASRAQMCQRELIAACDASSIAGTAMLTSYDTSPGSPISLSTAQQNAGAYARNMFQMQVVLGKTLTAANLTTSSSALYTIGAPNQCNVLVALGDPANNFTAVNLGDPLGRTVMVFCCYGYQPSFLSTLNLTKSFIPLNAASYAGLPQVDAVVVFDYSGSMDDFTSVLFVRREWYWPASYSGSIKQDVGCPMYSVVTGGSPGADNRLSNYINWSWTAGVSGRAGSATNVLPPQLLEGVSDPVKLPAIQNPLYYNPTLRSNPIFCTNFLGTNEVPVNNPSTQTTSSPALLGTAANRLPAVFGHYYSCSGSGNVRDGKLLPVDYGQPPGNYKPVFVAGDGKSSLTPTYFNAQYSSAPGSFCASTPFMIGIVQQFGYPPIPGKCQQYLSGSGANYAYQLTNSFNGTVSDNLNFTDLVVNLVNPVSGGEYATQPIPSTSDPVLNRWSFSKISFTFPSDEQDTRLASQSFTFSDLSTLVEAARGNMDNATNFNGACLDGGVIINTAANAGIVPPSTTPTNMVDSVTANYQLAYERCAMLESQPYATAVDGAVNAFYYKMATLCDARFGLVGFSDMNQNLGLDGSLQSQTGGTPAYQTSSANIYSQGTSPNNSCVHSEFSQFPPLKQSALFSATTGQVWERSGSTGSSGPQPPVYSSAIWAYVSGSPAAVSPAQSGYKLPRTALTATSPAAATDPQFDMVSSAASPGVAPVNNATITSTQSPYPTGNPYGDVWSADSTSGIANGCWNGRPLGGTYCDEALSTAFNSYTASNGNYAYGSRKAARKAIVFFTDGEPTGGVTAAPGTGVAGNSYSVANLCTNNSTSMYTIGLNMSGNTTLSADQYMFLGDGLATTGSPAPPPVTSQQGLAYLAGNGSRFFPCGTGIDVRNAFASVARRLSQAQN